MELINKAGEDRKESVITLVEEKFERRLSEVKAEIIKWMFIFWVGQIGAMFAILFAFLK